MIFGLWFTAQIQVLNIYVLTKNKNKYIFTCDDAYILCLISEGDKSSRKQGIMIEAKGSFVSKRAHDQRENAC